MISPTMWYVRPERLRSACAYAQCDHSLCQSLEYIMDVKLLTEQHLEFLSLKDGCTDSSESTLVNLPHRWKSHVTAHFYLQMAPLFSRKKQFVQLWIMRNIFCEINLNMDQCFRSRRRLNIFLI